jgi:hypothetical protein
MDRLAIVAIDCADANTPVVVNRGERMQWGLSGRLPRLCAFDGRRSRVAPDWITATAQVQSPVSRLKPPGRNKAGV